MNWTTEKPTGPGYYWLSIDGYTQMVKVGDERYSIFDVDWFYCLDGPESELNGNELWYGPLEIPQITPP